MMDLKALTTSQRIAYDALVGVFTSLVKFGWSPIEVNAFTIGMCRSSMEDILGKEGAIAEDLAWRKNIGWISSSMKESAS
ncbi:hypothetical protein LCGC14_1393460 [marine sediment metagenome]|uniref:Uncharacterized protein n=1 Tax=marine sediment metagenome TaxID=412755 RepID=A0A0F9MER9_9ZZZZ